MNKARGGGGLGDGHSAGTWWCGGGPSPGHPLQNSGDDDASR